MSISSNAVTRMNFDGGMWVPLHTTFPAKTLQISAGEYNAIGYFSTGGSVTIVIYDLADNGAVVATDTAACTELGTTGVYTWDLDNLTVPPIARKQYGWRMTDSSAFEAGTITAPEPFVLSRLNPILHR